MSLVSSRALLLCALLVAPALSQDPRCFFIPDNDPTAGTCNIFPFGSSGMTYQTMVPAASVGPGSITSLAFAPCNTTTNTLVNVEIRMATSNLAAMDATFANNLVSPAGGFIVLSRVVFNWNMVANGWTNIPLDRHFNYDGVDNLVIQVRVDATAGIPGACHRGSTVERVFAASSSAASGTVDMAALKMRICMGEFYYSDSTDPTAGTCNVFPFGQAQMRYQQLVTAADLGNRAGVIRDLAFTPCASGSTNYGTLQIRLAHTTATSLSTANTFDSNLADPPLGVTVLNGTNFLYNYTLNEWSPVGLTGSFAYNGVDNLVVDVVAFGGTQSFHRDSTRWRAWNNVAAATNPSGTGISALKIRLAVECLPATRNISAFSDGCGPVGSGLGIGTNTPLMGLPVIGGTHELLMRFGPPGGLGAFIIGFNAGVPFPLPVPGAPGCFQRTDIAGVLFTLFDATGFSQPVPFSIPNSYVYCGTVYYAQGVAFWPGINPLGIASSNLLTMNIGI